VRGDNKQAHRRVTVTLQDELVLKAQELVDTQSTSELIRQALVALIERESARAPCSDNAGGARAAITVMRGIEEGVCHKIAHLAPDGEAHSNEATLTQLVADLHRAVAEACSVVREAISDVRATLEELRRSRPH